MQKLRKGDQVVVTSGKDRGKIGRILQIIPTSSKILVSGINLGVRHLKPSKESEGKIVKQEFPIHMSNVSYYTKDGKLSKIGFRYDGDIKKRFLKKTMENI